MLSKDEIRRQTAARTASFYARNIAKGLCRCGGELQPPFRTCVKCRQYSLERNPPKFGRRIVISVQERFWSHVDKSGECWVWTGARGGDGYGEFFYKRKRRSHRVVWELTNGAIPHGMHILHRCDNPSCVNPAHLFLGTHKDNMRDMKEKGRLNTSGLCPRRPRKDAP